MTLLVDFATGLSACLRYLATPGLSACVLAWPLFLRKGKEALARRKNIPYTTPGPSARVLRTGRLL